MSKRASTDKAGTYGLSEETLKSAPTVFRDGLLDGQVVLVSGAGSGLGKAIAYLFARLGADLVISGRDEDKLARTEADLINLGAKVHTQAMTIRDPEAVASLIDDVWQRFGKLDILVNNAGGQFPQPAIDFSIKGWQAVIDTNLNGTWYMMQNAAHHWRDAERAGSIVNIVAVVDRGMPHLAHTCAARAGVIHLSKSVSIEWAPMNIRVNCVAPGCVETSAFGLYPPEGRATFYEANPMHRAGDEMDVAEACVYLAAPSGKFITGETIHIDGGQQNWGDPWANGRPEYFRLGGD